MAIACVLALALLQEPRCDLAVPGRPLKEIVAAMAKQSGEPLSVDDILGTQPVIVRFKSVPISEAKSRLAEVMRADWVTRNGRQLLTRTQATTDKLLAERERRREAAFRATLAEMFGWAAKAEKIDEISAQRLSDDFDRVAVLESEGKLNSVDDIEERALSKTAEWRLMYDMARNIDPAELARLGTTRIVYSTRPTAAQRPTPNVDVDRIAQYIVEHNAFAKHAGEDRQSHLMATSTRARLGDEIVGPVHALLTLSSEVGSSWAGLSLRVIGDDGADVATAHHQLTLVKNTQLLAGLESARNRAKDETKLNLSAVATELATRRGARGPLPPLSAEALGVLTNPEKHDPFGIVFGPALIEIAEREGRNVVASVGDGLATGSIAAVRREAKPALIENTIARYGARLERPEGWLLGVPEDQLLIEAGREDRAALGHFMRSMRDKGYAGISDWSTLAAASWLEEAGISSVYSGYLRGEAGTRGEGVGSWDLLKLLGSLTSDQVGTLRGGGSVSLRALTPAQSELVRRMIYLTRVELNRPEGKEGYQSRLEPTTVLPTGFPGVSSFKLAEKSKDLMLAHMPGHRTTVPVEDVDQLAAYAAMAERTDLFPWAGESDRIHGVRFGTERTITLVFDFGDGIGASAAATEEIVPSGPGTPLKEVAGKLSEANRAKFEARVAELRAQYAKMTPQGARRLNPAPVPPP